MLSQFILLKTNLKKKNKKREKKKKITATNQSKSPEALCTLVSCEEPLPLFTSPCAHVHPALAKHLISFPVPSFMQHHPHRPNLKLCQLYWKPTFFFLLKSSSFPPLNSIRCLSLSPVYACVRACMHVWLLLRLPSFSLSLALSKHAKRTAHVYICSSCCR